MDQIRSQIPIPGCPPHNPEMHVTFSRTMAMPTYPKAPLKGVSLEEQMTVRRVGGVDNYYYRSRWVNVPGTRNVWSDWGFWDFFPEGTTNAQILSFMIDANWKVNLPNYSGE